MNKLVEQILEKHFKQEKEDPEKIFNQLTFYIYSLDSDQNDLYILAKILDPESLQKIITYFDGRHIKIPTNKKFQENMLIALCFYLKEIKGWNWTEIKNFMDLPEKYKKHISTISLGGKINKIKSRLTNDLKTLIDNIGIDEFHKLFTQKLGKDFCGDNYEE